ncbi:MAG: cell division protein ZapA [Muribaculum sp.]|nr:cell division protein ZapA [Muribaculum sp.]
MEVNIAGERLMLTVPFSRQLAVRNTEKELKALYEDWGTKFPKKSPKALLAMIAYKFASSYFDLLDARNALEEEAQSLLDDISRLCGESAEDESIVDEFPLY